MKRHAALILAFALAFLFPYEADATHASLTSAAYDAHSGELTLKFSTNLDGELQGFYIPIRDGATANTGGFNLSDENFNVGQATSYTYHFSVAHRASINAMSDPHVHHTFRGGHGGGLYTAAGVPLHEFVADISVTADTTKPTLDATTAPAYDPDTGVLTLTLVEPVKSADADVDQSKIHINNSSTASGGTSLNGATVSSTGNSATVTIAPTQAQRATVSGYETPHVYFTAGAVNDLSNNANAASSTATALAIKPQLSPGKSSLADDGALAVEFKRAVKSADADVDQSKIHVRDGSGTTGGTSLNGATVSSTGDSKRITITPTSAQRAAILGYTAPHVYFTAGAVTSATDVDIPASTASAPLSRPPELASAAVDLNGFSQTVASQTMHYAGKLTLTFSEAVEAHTSAADTLPKITVREQDNSPTLTLDATSAILTASDTSVVIALSPSQKEAVKAMSGGLEVLIAAQAFKSSLSSLPQRVVGDGDLTIASQNVTQDTTGPVAASVSVDEGTGVLTLTFDEHVKDGADVDLAKISVANDPFTAGGTALTGSAVTSSADTDAQVTIKLSEALRKAVIGYAAPNIRFDLGAVKDLGNRDIVASAVSAEIDDTPDTTAPTLVATGQNRPALDEGTGILTLTFSESVKDGSDVDLEKIFVTGSATASGGTALSVSGDVSEITSTVDTDSEITVKVREVARLAAIGHTTPHVYLDAGAVKDLSDQNVAASTVAAQIADTADDDPPVVESAALDEGAGTLTITFDETVDVSSADGAKFKIREGANAGSSGELALSSAEITAGQSDGTTLTFGLTEDSRQAAIALNVPYLYVDAGAITDTISPAANSIAADTGGKIIGLTPDGAAPTIVSAEATALNKITVTFSERVQTADETGLGWSISGTDAGSLQVSQNSGISSGSTTVVLTLSGSLPDTGPDIALRYEISGTDAPGDPGSGSGAITDTSSNALAAISSVTVSDGIAPEVSSAKYVSRSSVVITFSEPVKLSGTAPTGWTVSGADKGDATGAGSFGTITTSVAVSSDTMTLNNDLADKTRLDFTLSYAASGNLEDAAGNDLKQYSAKPSDGFGPRIVSAESGTLNTITVGFSENVNATGTSGDGGWSLSGADSGSLTVLLRSDISNTASESLTLTLSGNLSDPIGTVELAYGGGDVEDESDNALASQTVSVTQDLAPAIASAEAVSASQIEVTFTETVTGSATDADGTWKLHGTDSAGRTVTAYPGASSNSVTLDISPALTTTSPSLQLQYVRSPGDIQDTSSKPLPSTVSPHVTVSDGIAPTIASARATSLNTIEVTFSEALSVSDTSAQGWSVSGGDAAGRTVDSSTAVSSGTTTVLTLSSNMEDTKPDGVLLQYKTLAGDVGSDSGSGSGAIADPASNALAARSSIPVSDGIAPTITSAKATSLRTIEVTFSESLASGADAQGWSISGGDAAGRSVASGAGSGSSLVLTLDAGLAGTRPDGVLLQYKTSPGDVNNDPGSGSGAIADPASNALAARSSIPVSDGIAPTVSSSKYTSRNAVELTFSEPVRLASGSVPTGWSATGADAVASPTNASSITALTTSSATSSAVLTLDADLADKTLLDFTLSYSNGNIEDQSDNALASYSASPSDGIAPRIVSAESRALNEITVVFSEAVSATSTGASATWQLSGTGLPAGVTVSGNPAISSSHTVLTLSGNLSTPIGAVELAYVASAGDVQDGSSNALAAQSVSVSQNLIPTIVSSKITGPNQITITYNEPVTASAGAYSGLTVGTARTITSYTQTSAVAHVLVFGGPAAGTGAAGTLTIDQTKVSDGVLNLGTSSLQQALSDGQAPTFTADVTDTRTVTVTFSEQVSSSDNAASHWTLSGADAQAVSSVSALSNSGTMAVTVGADFAANVTDLQISYSAAGTVSDSAGNVLAAVSNSAVSDDQRPSIASAVAGTDNSITVTLTRQSSGSATDAGATWTLSGADAAGLSVSGYLGVSSDTVRLALSGNLPDTAPDLSLSYNSGVGDIADAAGKQMLDQTVQVSDGLKPRIEGAALNEGTGILTVTFTEQVTVASGLHLRESGSAGGIPLPSASGAVLSFTLSEAQRQQAVAFEAPSLRMDAGAATDAAGLSSEADDVRITATADAVPPVAGSAALDLGTGILTISFDENLGPAADPSPLSISGSLAGAQVSVSGSTATVTLTEQQRQAAIGQTSPSLVLGAGAFRDVSGTGSAAATLPLLTVPDDDEPRLVTAALNTDTSVLVLEFDETMDVSAFGAQLTHVRITGGAQEIPVSGTVSRDGVKVRVQVDRPTLDAVLDSISASLRLETRGAQFEDTSGNAAPQADEELAIGDDSPPRLVSASVISPDTVLVVFHEDLDGSSVQPSDFEVGGLAPISASEERGTVTLKLDADYGESDAPAVSLTGSVSDLFGNAQSSGSVQSVNNIVRVTISEFTVSASGGLAVAGEQVSISFRATEPVQNPALSINGEAVSVISAENGFTASYAVPPGSPQGPLSISLSVESMTGTPASFTERDLTAPNVSVDTVVPALASASASGVDSVTVRYSEPVSADASGASVEVSSVTYPVSVSGSGSETVLVYWDGAGSVPASAVLRGLAVQDIAGNPGPAGPVSAGPSTDSASPGPTGVMPIARGTTLRTVEVPAGIEPALELSSASATDQRVLFAGGRTAELENPLSVITREPGLPDLFFQAGTEVGGLGGLTVASADLEAAILVSPSDYEVPSGSPELDEYPELRNPATAVLVGSPVSDIAFSKPVRIEFDAPLSGLVFTVNASGAVLPIPACAEGYGGALPLLQEAPDLWTPETYDPLACILEDSVWTLHFSVFGVAHRVSSSSECDDCTPPTLGYDSYGARLVDGGFAYNGLASDVEYFFTPYPLIESEVGKQNTVSLKIYENEGPQNVQHVSIAFGLRSGEVVSESKAVINYDIFADGTGAVSVIDPENAIDDSLSASHEVVECAAGSALECLSVTVSHAFRAPLEFDIVGTDVWDSQRNSWQNYFNHGLRVTGESMNPVPGVAVNGGTLVLHPIVEGSNNVEVMAGEDGALYRLSPDGLYEPLRNISSLFHSIDESMYTYRGTPMQGYDRSDPEFAGAIDEQIALAKAVLERMNLGRQGWQESEAEQSVHTAIDRLELLRADIAAERQRAEQVFLDRYGPTDRPE